MKTLANCETVEFLRQTNRIRHAVSGWIDETGIREIRKHMPELTGKETPEEKKAALEEQARRNMNDMLDAMLDAHAEETAGVLGMLCFMDPEEAKKVPAFVLVAAALEMLNSKPVIDFFVTLMKLGQTNTAA